VLDEAALPLDTLRVRERGSHGGHNGLRSLIELLGTDEFPRVRIGVGSSDPIEISPTSCSRRSRPSRC
jgi:PTH1 family peptidyl-tRNA hydrolase